jgi:hypothetical protein
MLRFWNHQVMSEWEMVEDTLRNCQRFSRQRTGR